MPLLRDGARVLMKLMPPGTYASVVCLLFGSINKIIDLKAPCVTCIYFFLLFFLDNTTVENLRAVCLDHAKLGENSLSPSLDSRFFGPSPSQVLYLIEVGV